MAEHEQSNANSIRVKHTHRSRYKSQRRHDLRIGHQPGYVDGNLSGLNRVLVDLPMPALITSHAKKLRQRTNPSRAMRADAAVATIDIITFGHAAQPIFEALSTTQQDDAFLEVARRIADEYVTPAVGCLCGDEEGKPFDLKKPQLIYCQGSFEEVTASHTTCQKTLVAFIRSKQEQRRSMGRLAIRELKRSLAYPDHPEAIDGIARIRRGHSQTL